MMSKFETSASPTNVLKTIRDLLAAIKLHGCVCPAGAEATCKGPLCPRQGIQRTAGVVKQSATTKDVIAFKRAADAFVRKATSSAKAANQTMMRLGIQDAKGALTKHYK